MLLVSAVIAGLVSPLFIVIQVPLVALYFFAAAWGKRLWKSHAAVRVIGAPVQVQVQPVVVGQPIVGQPIVGQPVVGQPIR